MSSRGDNTVRELSGVLSSAEKWDAAFEALAAPDCQITTLRLMHNTDEHVERAAAALAGNRGLEVLEVGVLGGSGAAALAGVIQVCGVVMGIGAGSGGGWCWCPGFLWGGGPGGAQQAGRVAGWQRVIGGSGALGVRGTTLLYATSLPFLHICRLECVKCTVV